MIFSVYLFCYLNLIKTKVDDFCQCKIVLYLIINSQVILQSSFPFLFFFSSLFLLQLLNLGKKVKVYFILLLLSIGTLVK